MEEQKFVIFQLADQKYGMHLMRVNGIEQDYHIIPVPNAPEGINGIINLRGTVIPVYSLRERFGMNPRIDNPGKSLLVTNSNGTLLAYEVDAVEEIEEVSKEWNLLCQFDIPSDTFKSLGVTNFKTKIMFFQRKIISQNIFK